MKTNKILNGIMALALIGGSFTVISCDDDEEYDLTKFVVVSFENQTLNSDGYWIGSSTGTGISSEWGTTYNCSYTESDLQSNIAYTTSGKWESFMGIGISNRTATTFADATLTPDQYNNVTGKANTGKNFAVVYGDNSTITVNKANGVNIKGLFFTNATYVKYVVEEGNAYAKKFESGDYLKVTITADNGKKVEFYPADYRSGKTIVNKWTWLDLSSLGTVKSLTFTFDGTDKGIYGLNTPSYICIDDVTYVTE